MTDVEAKISYSLLQAVAVPKKLLLGAIWCYQQTKILRRPSCRFYPSCSEYMAGSVRRFGLLKGITSGIARLFRCHPFHAGGVDEIPLDWQGIAVIGAKFNLAGNPSLINVRKTVSGALSASCTIAPEVTSES
jgi:putative membrane protein insertion efficiency factor